jgi:hypothetical protein
MSPVVVFDHPGFCWPEISMGVPIRRNFRFAQYYRMIANVMLQWPVEWPTTYLGTEPQRGSGSRQVHKAF